MNLLPTKGSSSRRAGGAPSGEPVEKPIAAYGLLGALAAGAAVVVALVLAGNDVRAAQADVDAATADAQRARAEMVRLAPYGAFRATALSRTETVRGLAASRFDWAAALRGLSRAVPRDVNLQAITGSVAASVSAEGGASNPLRPALDVPALELVGCADEQPRVAELMARLNAVRGVTRVTLSSSEKPSDDPAGAAAPGTAAASPDPDAVDCQGDDPPTFNVVMFFEEATAAPGTQASATPTATPAASPDPSSAPAAGATPAPTAEAPAAGAATTQDGGN